ncbi:hypothetical protein GCM10020227_34250 [Streptomyces flavovirens]
MAAHVASRLSPFDDALWAVIEPLLPEAEVWPRLHEVLLAELRSANALDFSGAAVDGSHIRSMKGGSKTGRSPVDRKAEPAASTTWSPTPPERRSPPP